MPEIKRQIVDMALNGRGILDTTRVLGIGTGIVVREQKKQTALSPVNTSILEAINTMATTVIVHAVKEAKLDEQGAWVVKKGEIDMTNAVVKEHPTGVAPNSSEAEKTRVTLTPEQRQQIIAEMAYHKAEQRGFTPGSEEADWLEAEKEVERKVEHRCCRRDELTETIDVKLFKDGKLADFGTISNLNCHGIFVKSDAVFDEGSHMRLQFTLPSTGEAYRPWARVSHSANEGLGLFLDVLEPDSRKAVEALLSHTGRTESQ